MGEWQGGSSSPGFTVGSRVLVHYGTSDRAAIVIEDRGPIGVGGRRLLRILMDEDEDPFEVPAEELEPLPSGDGP